MQVLNCNDQQTQSTANYFICTLVTWRKLNKEFERIWTGCTRFHFITLLFSVGTDTLANVHTFIQIHYSSHLSLVQRGKDMKNIFLHSSIKFCCVRAASSPSQTVILPQHYDNCSIWILCLTACLLAKKEASVLWFYINRRLKHPFTHLSLLCTFYLKCFAVFGLFFSHWNLAHFLGQIT